MLDSKVCFRMIALNFYDVLYLLVDCNTSAQPTGKQSQELISCLVKYSDIIFPPHILRPISKYSFGIYYNSYYIDQHKFCINVK